MIKILPAYSQLDQPIGEIGTSAHQRQTWDAMASPDVDAIINIAATGDGKSWAAYKPHVAREREGAILALYPTNALAGDQLRQLKENEPSFLVRRLSGQDLDRWVAANGEPIDPEIEVNVEVDREQLSRGIAEGWGKISAFRHRATNYDALIEAESLSNYAAIHNAANEALDLLLPEWVDRQEGALPRKASDPRTKGRIVRSAAANCDALLTTPDMWFHMHVSGSYISGKDKKINPDSLWSVFDENFSTILFDEFHVYEAPQITGILNTIALMRAAGMRHKLVFLSATPSKILLKGLEGLGLKTQVIQGQYATEPMPGYRPIAQPINLHLEEVDRVESWLESGGIEDIFGVFDREPESRCAILMNSIAGVHRVSSLLEKKIKQGQKSLSVATMTRLTRGGINADIVVGTSTIDVGVDFRINLLIFEAPDAASFIQRFGRLGRHSGFESYTAIACLGKFAKEQFVEHLKEGTVISREHLSAIARKSLPTFNNFANYFADWGLLQGMAIAVRHSECEAVQVEYKRLINKLWVQNETAKTRVSKAAQINKQVLAQTKSWGLNSNTIAREYTSFRGSSPWQCLVIDTRDGEAVEAKSYDLPGLLWNFDIDSRGVGKPAEIYDRAADFWSRSKRKSKISKRRPAWLRYSLIGCQINDVLPFRRDWKLVIQSRPPLYQLGACAFRLWCPELSASLKLSAALQSLPVAAFFVPLSVSEARTHFRLPNTFSLYPVSDSPYGESGISVAIGLDALKLYSCAGHNVYDPVEFYKKPTIDTGDLDDDADFLARYLAGADC